MDWIQTYTGRRFRPLSPDPAQVDVRDIAHALSLICRFNGHCRCFYSVAEHSVRVSRQTEGADALWGLLHDAGEAYLADLPRPVKPRVTGFDVAEQRVLEAVLTRYGLSMPMPPSVKHADDVLLATEARDLMGADARAWGLQAAALAERIEPLAAPDAEALFLARFDALVPRTIAGGP